jgi:UDP-N-acetylglucosamine--N-acetylmuramyl-(pentapeptide) pyrophosphoryl-undecaprenol N-acetylglucosamine transferase
MPSAYSGAALAIARAGGTTLSELAIFGVPSILVPYPHHKDCHQMANARIFTGAAAARIIEEGKGAGAALAAAAKEMLADSAALRKMHVAAKTLGRPEAARTVASRINESLQGRRAVANS